MRDEVRERDHGRIAQLECHSRLGLDLAFARNGRGRRKPALRPCVIGEDEFRRELHQVGIGRNVREQVANGEATLRCVDDAGPMGGNHQQLRRTRGVRCVGYWRRGRDSNPR